MKTDVSGYRIGDLLAITAPGEIFGSISTVVKSQIRRKSGSGGQTMVFGQTQDSLGYIIQSYEVDPVGGLPSNVETQGNGDVASTRRSSWSIAASATTCSRRCSVGRNLG